MGVRVATGDPDRVFFATLRIPVGCPVVVVASFAVLLSQLQLHWALCALNTPVEWQRWTRSLCGGMRSAVATFRWDALCVRQCVAVFFLNRE